MPAKIRHMPRIPKGSNQQCFSLFAYLGPGQLFQRRLQVHRRLLLGGRRLVQLALQAGRLILERQVRRPQAGQLTLRGRKGRVRLITLRAWSARQRADGVHSQERGKEQQKAGGWCAQQATCLGIGGWYFGEV